MSKNTRKHGKSARKHEKTHRKHSKNVEAQKEYKISAVPTIIIFKDDEEVKRFQADLSFKMVATREEIQDEINEQLMSDF